MKTSEKGVALIEHFEGIRLTAYRCPAGIYTIGIGTTVYPDGRKVRKGDTCTEDQARLFLETDLRGFEDAVMRLVKVTINQDQFDSLVSFCYNLGSNALRTSSLLRVINLNPFDVEIPDLFLRWVYAGGQVMPGLVRRRKAEAHLYMTGDLKYEW